MTRPIRLSDAEVDAIRKGAGAAFGTDVIVHLWQRTDKLFTERGSDPGRFAQIALRGGVRL